MKPHTTRLKRTPHEAEWVYSNILSRRILTPLSTYVHDLPSPTSYMPMMMMIEIFFAAFGCAFNPALFPLWPMVVYYASGRRVRVAGARADGATAFHDAALFLTSAWITLAFTEIGKASFATTRPIRESGDDGDAELGRDERRRRHRRYGALVGSLKSRHSFPSGDCAQAMNFCMILCRYVPAVVPPTAATTTTFDDHHGRAGALCRWPLLLLGRRDAFLFGIFLPGVAFARVYYRCHWIEDCLGGIFMSWVLHNTIIPIVAGEIPTLVDSLFRVVENLALFGG